MAMAQKYLFIAISFHRNIVRENVSCELGLKNISFYFILGHIRVHENSLLLAVRTCYNIFLASRNLNYQVLISPTSLRAPLTSESVFHSFSPLKFWPWNFLGKNNISAKMLVKLTKGVDFTNMFTKSFYLWRSQNRKKIVKSSGSFCAFGICALKASWKHGWQIS